MIVSSFQSEYGIRLSRELDEMSWREFAILLSGLGSDTALSRVVAIRSEDDPKRVKEMSVEQKRMRNEWRKRQFQKKPKKEQDAMLQDLQRAVVSMVGDTK